MLFRILRNDLLRSKTATVTTTLFVTVSAVLITLAVVLFANLAGAIDSLMERAKTPHFLQMHAGTVDRHRLESFVRDHPEIVDYQVLEFFNVDGARIRVGDRSLAGSVQDNGFSVQSPRFDLLLDLDGTVLRAEEGEVYLPIVYLQSGFAGIGETLRVDDLELTVAGFLRDSLMNSPLSSSKRFLVSDADFARLRRPGTEAGTVEYLIEFRVTDDADLGALENAYITAGLESNGPTIMAPLFRTLNALTDGLTIALVLLLSALVLSVALLCIRFTLLARIEDDYREIGVMKAIGLRISEIRGVYLFRYLAITGLGSALGLATGFALQGLVLENIRLYMGESGRSGMIVLPAILAVAIMDALIIVFVHRVLRRFRRISPVEAIRYGVARDTPARVGRFKVRTSSRLPVNTVLGIKDLLARWNTSLTMLTVLIVAVFIVVVPKNLVRTISSDEFIRYMGMGIHDMRFDVQQTTDIPGKVRRITDAIAADERVSRYVVLTTKHFTLRGTGGTEERLNVELGDHSVFPITYATGRSPRRENEIALSLMNANALGTEVGETITVVIDGDPRVLTVSGIYSDVTNGGKTAKAIFTDNSAEVMWSVVAAELADPSRVDTVVGEYAGRFAFAKVSGIREFIRQTYGTTIDAIRRISSIAVAVALAICVLVSLLFVNLLVARDRYSIAVLKAVGFTTADIRSQYTIGAVLIAVLGVVLGTILANTAGEALAGLVIATFGASSFDFAVDVSFTYLIGPLSIVAVTLAGAYLATAKVTTATIYETIKE